MEAEICVFHLQNECKYGNDCPQMHFHLPYLWQIGKDDKWLNIVDSLQEDIERSFCNPKVDTISGELQVNSDNVDSRIYSFSSQLDFIKFKGKDTSENEFVFRRLSTASYAKSLIKNAKREDKNRGFYTHWNWYYLDENTWKLIGEGEMSPEQSVMETKFISKQEIYRFEVLNPANDSFNTFLIDLNKFMIINVEMKMSANLKRRPTFISLEEVKNNRWIPFPMWKMPPYLRELPRDWFPVDYKSDFELVPLNPSSMRYHLVLSEFQKTVKDKTICDIFSVQNAFLWDSFSRKKLYMEEKSKNANELMLFHGTSSSDAVKCILKQNFDWRLCGKNGSQFGKGCYFASDAFYSNRYSFKNNTYNLCWMFLARVLVGKYVRGNSDYARPPPLDFSKPHGAVYDSCVDNTDHPRIYVVFNSDQCYPQYLFSYK